MGKIIFWFFAILVVLTVWRMLNARNGRSPRAGAAPRRPGGPPAAKAAEPMVRCTHCGIHVPRSEAVLQNGQTWCSLEHARLGPPR
ncbi:PP0621 family protein [Bordetella genomosp. 12]|uniref:PP0621 family protein n=1 Tax=Bordetella genomosp. 12 TaxID=463035 RepID=UPI001ABF384D|nr:PP0621 family protein [Bordetella genomosp. 12]